MSSPGATRARELLLNHQVKYHDTPNENVIELVASDTHIGIVNRRLDPFEPDGHVDSVVLETGGRLIASQSASGHVYFIVHPRTSDRTPALKASLIIAGPLDPTEVTVARVHKVLRRYLLILRATALTGADDALSLSERMLALWTFFDELKTRHDRYRAILSLRSEWAKALVVGLAIGRFAGGIGGWLTASLLATVR